MPWLSLALVATLAVVPADLPPGREEARVILVEIEAVVRNSEGEAVTGLEAERFRVREASKSQKIERFEEVASARVVLLLDVSGSMEGHFWSARRAAWDLLRALGRDTEVVVLACGETPIALTDRVMGRAQVARKLAALPLQRDADTALLQCMEEASKILQSSSGRRQAIVVVSDGQETVLSGTFREAALAQLRDRLVIQAVRLDVLGYGRPGWLAGLARSTGGSWQRPVNGSRIVGELARRLAHHYEIGYYPASPHAGWQSVHIEVEGTGFEVDASEGYRLRRPSSRPLVD